MKLHALFCGGFLCLCAKEGVPAHGNVLGINAFMENLRLMVDEMTNEKFIICHSLDQDSAPNVALGDYMLPGEHMQQSKSKEIPRFHLVYNPYLYGTNIIMYSANSYDQANPKIVRLSLLYPLSPWLVDPPFVPPRQEFDWIRNVIEPNAAVEAYKTYRKPVVDFCRGGAAVVHHPSDFDYADWIYVDSTNVTVICYARPFEALIVVTAEETEGIGPFNVRINKALLGWKDEVIRLTDEVSGKAVHCMAEGDWIVVPCIDLAEWPRLLRLRPKADGGNI